MYGLKLKKIHTRIKELILIFLLLIPSYSVAGKVKESALSVKYKFTGSGSLFLLKGEKFFSYTAYRLIDPLRLIIDVTDKKFERTGTFRVKDPLVSKVVLVNKTGRGWKIARMSIALKKPVDYLVERKDDIVYVKLIGGAFSQPSDGGVEVKPLSQETPEETPEEGVEEEFEMAEELTEEIPEAPEESTGEATPVIGEEVTEEVPVTEKAETENIPEAAPEKAISPEETLERATKILDVKGYEKEDKTFIEITGNGPIEDYNAFKLDNPPRVVVDIRDVGNLFPSNEIELNTVAVKKVRLGQHPDKLRIALDIQEGVEPSYEVNKEGNKLILSVGKGITEAPTIEVAEAPMEEEVPEEKAPAKEVAPIEEVQPEEATSEETRPEEKSTVPALTRAEEKKEVKVEGAPPVPKPSTAQPRASKVIEGEKRNYFEFAPEELGMKSKYTGRKISLVFKDADIQDVLRVIAEFSNLNIIAGDDVKGKITIRLINVPWDQALDIILQSRGLGMVRIGNIIRVAPLAKLQEERAKIAEAQRSLEKVQSLITKLIPVNYAAAKDMTSKIEKLLTKRGSLQYDERTNTIILKDIPSVVSEAEKLIRSLDLQTPQVVISSRIVEVQENFTRELGIQWGGGMEFSGKYGNPTGLFFPNTINAFGNVPAQAGGGGGGQSQVNVGEAQNLFAVNLPAAVGVGSGGSIGFVLGSINNSAVLDLRLSALETQGRGKVISSPKILTLDNTEAEIKQGVSIPYETVSQSGTQTQFIDATLSLKVTPHITPDRSVIMKIKVEKNAPNEALRSAGGVPSIEKKEAQTEILVKDGETAVIGGIYKVDRSRTKGGIPLLSRIPIIGWLFRKSVKSNSKSELLVFITPEIVVKR